MTGNNLTYALIPRLSRCILSHRSSRLLARRDYFIIFLGAAGWELYVRYIPQVRIFSVVILTRWSAVPNDDALARRPDGGSCGAALHSDGCARNGTHSISARWSMRRRCRGDAAVRQIFAGPNLLIPRNFS